MRVADLRERIRRDLERRGVRLGKHDLRRVIGCACGYKGFALRGALLWRCPQCGRRARWRLASYELPVEAANLYIQRLEHSAGSRRWMRIAAPLAIVIASVAAVALAVVFVLLVVGVRFGMSGASTVGDYWDWTALKYRHLHAPTAVERREAAKRLIASGPEGRQLLVEELARQTVEVRQTVEEALAEAGSSVLPDLEKGLSQIPAGDVDAAWRFVRLFVRMGDPGRPALNKALRHFNRADQLAVVEELVTLAGGVGERRAVLQNLAEGEYLDISLRETIGKALAATSDPEGVPSLSRTLLDERYPNLHERAAESLGLIGDPAGLSALSAALLLDRDSKVRETAAKSLGLIGDVGAISVLSSAGANDQSPQVRAAASRAVTAIQSRKFPTPPTNVKSPAKRADWHSSSQEQGSAKWAKTAERRMSRRLPMAGRLSAPMACAGTSGNGLRAREETATLNSEAGTSRTSDGSAGLGEALPPVGAQAEGARMRVADLRERIQRYLERRGVKVRPKKELARVISCACGYQGFALRGTLFFWRCPQCGRRAKHDLACYDLPVKAADLFILERERLARSRRWVKIVVPLLVTALAIAAIVGGVFLLGLQFSVSTASEYKDFLAIKNRLHTQIVSKESLRIRLDAVREAILYGPNGRELLIADLAGQHPLVRIAIERALTNTRLTDLPVLEAALADIPPDDMEIALCFVRIFGHIGKPALASLQQGLGHSRPMVRFAAAKAMAAVGADPDEVLPALKELAAGDDKDKTSDLISAEAIKTLSDIGRPALTVLADLLRGEKRVNRRVAVVTAIGNVQPSGKDIADHLAPALDDEAASVRSQATHMLSRQGAVAFDLLSKLATEGAANNDVRLFAIRSLGTMGDSRAVPLLCQAVQNAKEAETRKCAAETLGAMGDGRATQTLCQALLSDKDPNVRQAAAKSLGGIGNAGLLPTLCAVSINDTSPGVQICAAGSVVAIAAKSGGIPVPASIPALSRALLSHSDPIVRRRAANCLGATADYRAVAPLRSALLGDAVRDVQKSAAENLGKLRNKNAAEALYQGLLSDLDVSVREAIAKGLVATNDPQAIPSLGKILADERYANLHERVADSLGLMGDPAGLAVLSAALIQNNNSKVRETVARSMGLIGDPSAISALQSAATGDGSPEVREAAKKALLAIQSGKSSNSPTTATESRK